MVGSVQVPEQVAVGADVELIDVTLPFVKNVPVFGNALLPLVNCVADVVTCQPDPEPVASLTVYCWSPAVPSTSC